MPPARVSSRSTLLALAAMVSAAAAAVITIRLATAPSAPPPSPKAMAPIVSESAQPVLFAAVPAASEEKRLVAPPSDSADEAKVAWLQAVAQGAPGAVVSSAPAQTAAPSAPALEEQPTAPRDWLTLAKREHIVVYTASWCSVCRRAKAWMDTKGVSYDEHDIDSSAVDAQTLLRLNPRRSIPTFDVDGNVMVGFSEQGFVDLVRRATAR
jgi:glutaredoxin